MTDLQFKVQIRDTEDCIVTEWLVLNTDDGSYVGIKDELAFLRKVLPDGRTYAEDIAGVPA